MMKVKLSELPAITVVDGFSFKEAVGRTTALETEGVSLAYFEMRPDVAFDLHFHKLSHEVYLCVSGAAIVTIDGSDTELTAGDILPFKPGQKHKGKAVGTKPFVFWAISSPAYSVEEHYACDDDGDLTRGLPRTSLGRCGSICAH